MKSTTHFIKYIYTARGYLAELETQFMIASSLEYITSENAKPILNEINEISRMVNKMIFSLHEKEKLKSYTESLTPDP